MVFPRYSEFGGKEGMSRSLFFWDTPPHCWVTEMSVAPMRKPETRKERQDAIHRPPMQIKILVLEKE
jgi:hypothetical protein